MKPQNTVFWVRARDMGQVRVLVLVPDQGVLGLTPLGLVNSGYAKERN